MGFTPANYLGSYNLSEYWWKPLFQAGAMVEFSVFHTSDQKGHFRKTINTFSSRELLHPSCDVVSAILTGCKSQQIGRVTIRPSEDNACCYKVLDSSPFAHLSLIASGAKNPYAITFRPEEYKDYRAPYASYLHCYTIPYHVASKWAVIASATFSHSTHSTFSHSPFLPESAEGPPLWSTTTAKIRGIVFNVILAAGVNPIDEKNVYTLTVETNANQIESAKSVAAGYLYPDIVKLGGKEVVLHDA